MPSPRFLDDEEAFLKRLVLSMALAPPPSRAYFHARLAARPPASTPKKTPPRK